ncbi:MAG: YqaA family protein [Chloroflexota bacterium]|jgi:membrane protein YqaA with SNARE-associated domain
MPASSRVQLRDNVISRKPFQIAAFAVVLAASLAALVFGRSYLEIERFLAYGYLGLFLISFCTATILFPLPWEAAVIAAGATLNPLLAGAIATAGATIGELTSYAVGYLGKNLDLGRYSQRYQSAQSWMLRYGNFAIFLFALLPVLIFDLIGIIAGSMRYPLWKFIAACFAGRLIRCLTEAYLGFGLWELIPQGW